MPLTRFGAEKQEFIDYLSKREVVHFKYEQNTYHMFGKVNDRRNISYIEDVKANAKGYETLARMGVKAKGRVG